MRFANSFLKFYDQMKTFNIKGLIDKQYPEFITLEEFLQEIMK